MYTAPLTLPFKVRELVTKLLAELSALSRESREPTFNGIVLQKLNAAPAKTIEGAVVFADGANWNPGAGAGFYGYHSGAWNKLG